MNQFGGNVHPLFFSPATSSASIPGMFDMQPQMMMQQPQVLQQPQMMVQQPQMLQQSQMLQQPIMMQQQPMMTQQQPQMMQQPPMIMSPHNSGRPPVRNASGQQQQQFRVVYQPMLVRVGLDGTPWQMVDEGAPPDVVGDYRQEEVNKANL